MRRRERLAGWSQTDLADGAGLSLPAIKRLEREDGGPAVSDDAKEKVRAALDKAGVEFIAENSEEQG